MNSEERYDKSHTFTSNGGEITLNDDKTIRLNVPKGAFKQDTLVKWSLHEDDTSRFPELDIIALDVKSGQEVPVFEKHVMIIHKNRGCPPEDLSAIVDNQGLPNQQVKTKDRDIEDDCMFHTFYSSTPEETTICTKHFSKFRLLCSKETYTARLNAALFTRQQATEDAVHVDVKVVLDVNNMERKKTDKRSWKIHDSDDYDYIQTILINTPPGDDVVEKNGTFNCSVTVRNKDWEYIDKTPTRQPLENVIPCRKCHGDQLLPDAAILQFRSDGTGSKSFVAKLKFEILPSKDDKCTVTEYDALIRINVSQEAISKEKVSVSQLQETLNQLKAKYGLESSCDQEAVSTFQSTIPTNTSTTSLKEHIQTQQADSSTNGEERLDSGIDLSSMSIQTSTPSQDLPHQSSSKVTHPTQSDRDATQSTPDVITPICDTTRPPYDVNQSTRDVSVSSAEPSSTTDSVPLPNQSHFVRNGVQVNETEEKSVIAGPTSGEFEAHSADSVRPDVCLHPSTSQSDLLDRELTDANISTLSSRLMKDKVKLLALHLGVSSADINSSFTDHSTVSDAANHILTNWLHSQNDRKEAYRNMGEALRHKDVNLKLIAREVLDYPPVGQNQD